MEVIKLTTQDIKNFNPCYCPTRYLPEDWSGSLVDILKMDKVSVLDRLWVARHAMGDKGNRLFAVWCAREALKMLSDPDPRSTEACNVAERYANGEATKEELKVARTAAAATAAAAAAWATPTNTAAAATAARAAADATAARAAAAAADAAAYADAAYAAADAAYAAATAATWADATWADATYAAWATAAARQKARQAQINYLIKEMG